MINAGEIPATIEQERQSVITRNLRFGYVITNGASSIGELATGLLSGDVALAVDGLHGTSEIWIGNTQMKDAHTSDHVRDGKRRAIYTALCGISLAGAGVATGDLAGAWDVGVRSLALDSVGVTSAAVSAGSGVVAASIIVHRLRKKYGTLFSGRHLRKEIAPTEQDVVKHIVFLDSPSSTLAFMSSAVRLASYWLSAKHGLGASLASAESAIGIASGLWGAYLFRPSRKNLEHHPGEHTRETLPPAVEELVRLTAPSEEAG